MQLTLNVLIFFLGFCLAVIGNAKPKRSRAALERTLENVNYIFSAVSGSVKRKDAATRENKEPPDLIYTKLEVEQQYEDNSWQRNAYEDLKATLLSDEPPFPCIYAKKGYRANEHRYVFLESDNPNEARNLRRVTKALQEYLTLAPSLGANTSLVIVAAPPYQDNGFTVEEYRKQFWHMLKGLHVADPERWPTDMPTETTSPGWTFCFDGIPLFLVALTPAHEKRASRQASSFTIAIQPKWVLDRLLATPQKRHNATSKVRDLLKQYDDVGISPDLTTEPGTSEARQLFLLDHNDKSSECPFADLDD